MFRHQSPLTSKMAFRDALVSDVEIIEYIITSAMCLTLLAQGPLRLLLYARFQKATKKPHDALQRSNRFYLYIRALAEKIPEIVDDRSRSELRGCLLTSDDFMILIRVIKIYRYR